MILLVYDHEQDVVCFCIYHGNGFINHTSQPCKHPSKDKKEKKRKKVLLVMLLHED